MLQQLPIAIGHRAFVAGSVRHEHARNALNLLDRAVDPRPIGLPAVAIDRETRFAVVETTDHQIRPAEHTHAEVVNDVAGEVVNVNRGIDFLRALGSDFGLESAGVRFAIQDRSREVRVFDAILIRDEDVADAEQREVLDDLIAKRADPDHHHLRGRELLLIPPADETKAIESIVRFAARLFRVDTDRFAHESWNYR